MRISGRRSANLQRNLIRSHAAGVGVPLPEPVVRAMMLLRANVLALGHSGVRIEIVAELLCEMLNRGVTRCSGAGSVGASGDLAPLAHLALVVIGEGEAFVEGQRLPGARRARPGAGWRRSTFEAKEGSPSSTAPSA